MHEYNFASDYLACVLVPMVYSCTDPSTPFYWFPLMNNNMEFWQVQGVRGIEKVPDCHKVRENVAGAPSSPLHTFLLQPAPWGSPQSSLIAPAAGLSKLWHQYPSTSLCSMKPPREASKNIDFSLEIPPISLSFSQPVGASACLLLCNLVSLLTF